MVEESGLLEQLKVWTSAYMCAVHRCVCVFADVCVFVLLADYQGLLPAGSRRALPGVHRSGATDVEDAANGRDRARSVWAEPWQLTSHPSTIICIELNCNQFFEILILNAK